MQKADARQAGIHVFPAKSLLSCLASRDIPGQCFREFASSGPPSALATLSGALVLARPERATLGWIWVSRRARV